MSEKFNPTTTAGNERPQPNRLIYRKTMRWARLLVFALVASVTASFFGSANSDLAPLLSVRIQVLNEPADFSNVQVMRAQLRAAAPVHSHTTKLVRSTVWARVVLPASSTEPLAIHLPDKNIGRADFAIFDTEGHEYLRGHAGIQTSLLNAERALPGFVVRLPELPVDKSYEAIFRFEPIGVTRIRAELWHYDDFHEAQISSEQRTTLLIGSLLFLAVYALSAAHSGHVEHLFVFGVWLASRASYETILSGFNFFSFGELAGSDAGLVMRQFFLLAYPFVSLILIKTLFREAIEGSVLARALNRAIQAGAIILACTAILPFAVFQSLLWILAAATGIFAVWSVLHTAIHAKDKSSYWFAAGIFLDTIGSAAVVLQSTGVIEIVGPWLQLEQVSLLTAILTGIAVGTTIAKERHLRIDSQDAAIAALERYEAVYRTVPIGLVSIGHAGQIEHYNQGFARMFGLDVMTTSDNQGQAIVPGPDKLNSVFPTDLRERIRTGLTENVECDFEFGLSGEHQGRWLRVLARGEPGAYEASATDVTEQRQLQERLAKAAEEDSLTGALNRLGLSNRLERLMAEGNDLQHVALCFIDLDRFKMLNDMYGHHAGDSVLVDVVSRLRRMLGNDAAISRHGGDEFVVILKPADQSVQEGLAWKALEAITESPFHFDNKSFLVTASIGVFHLVPGIAPAELLAGADRACQEAKRKGRNQVMMCTDSFALVEQRRNELKLVARLHDEQSFMEFALVAQPIIALSEHGRSGCEILLRHRNADGVLAPPGPIIAAAEQNGEMACIDRWVVRQSLEWMSANHTAIRDLNYVSINLSGSSLNDEFFKTFVIALLQKHRSVASQVVLEVTESVAMQDLYMLMKFIESVQATGARIALDDFGSGYSNFASLTDIKASILKIDGRFITSLVEKGSAQSIIRTIGSLAHELHMECVAEWVEDSETLEMLRTLGIDYGQGFVLARPMPLDELLKALADKALVNDPAIRAQLKQPVRELPNESGSGTQSPTSAEKEKSAREEQAAFHAL